MTILQDISAEQAELQRLREENARLKARAAKAATSRIRMKVSEKGALSLYGMGRFPVTLYASQWRTLLTMTEEIKAFLEDNAGSLSVKED